MNANPGQSVVTCFNDTGGKYIAGVSDTGDKHKLRIFVKFSFGPDRILRGPEET